MSSSDRIKVPKISDFPPEQVNPAVLILLEICHYQHEQIQELRDEIARLKGHNPRPKIKPSALLSGKKKRRAKPKRCGKRNKTRHLEIHQTVILAPPEIPEGSRFKGYEDFTVQDIRIELHNTRYRLERWQTPSGERLMGKLPTEVGGAHFGPILRALIVYLYHHAHVTQPLILELVREWDIDISAGHLNTIITEDKDAYHAEKDALLRRGLEQSDYIHVDDTGARHQGKNGYCTHIGNEQFAWFASTESKSRINFLGLMRAGREDYVLNQAALEYMRQQKLPLGPLEQLAGHEPKISHNQEEWESTLAELGISGSTRSDQGRRCRDTFTSLKKTCRKNGISFWAYLLDRQRGAARIPPLADWIFEPTSAGPRIPPTPSSASP